MSNAYNAYRDIISHANNVIRTGVNINFESFKNDLTTREGSDTPSSAQITREQALQRITDSQASIDALSQAINYITTSQGNLDRASGALEEFADTLEQLMQQAQARAEDTIFLPRGTYAAWSDARITARNHQILFTIYDLAYAEQDLRNHLIYPAIYGQAGASMMSIDLLNDGIISTVLNSQYGDDTIADQIYYAVIGGTKQALRDFTTVLLERIEDRTVGTPVAAFGVSASTIHAHYQMVLTILDRISDTIRSANIPYTDETRSVYYTKELLRTYLPLPIYLGRQIYAAYSHTIDDDIIADIRLTGNDALILPGAIRYVSSGGININASESGFEVARTHLVAAYTSLRAVYPSIPNFPSEVLRLANLYEALGQAATSGANLDNVAMLQMLTDTGTVPEEVLPVPVETPVPLPIERVIDYGDRSKGLDTFHRTDTSETIEGVAVTR